MGRIKRCNGYILIKWAIGGVMMTLHECFIKGRLASRLASPTTTFRYITIDLSLQPKINENPAHKHDRNAHLKSIRHNGLLILHPGCGKYLETSKTGNLVSIPPAANLPLGLL